MSHRKINIGIEQPATCDRKSVIILISLCNLHALSLRTDSTKGATLFMLDLKSNFRHISAHTVKGGLRYRRNSTRSLLV